MAHRQNNGPAKPSIGHNSNLNDEQKKKLSGFIQEIEHANAEAKQISSDRSELYKAAEEDGFDTKAIRHVIKMRAMESGRRNDFESAVDAYRIALGDFITTPLGAAMQPQPDAH
jgi:uncharacterized protein (UPF0335 family)